MDEQNKTLAPRQREAIPKILAAKNITEGVKKARIKRETFYSWLKDPLFKAEFARQRDEIIDLALYELKSTASEAVNVLKSFLNAESESVRFRSATAILEHISKFRELESIERRIEAIERKMEK